MSYLRRPQDWAITGATIENIYNGERFIIGGIVVRNGGFL